MRFARSYVTLIASLSVALAGCSSGSVGSGPPSGQLSSSVFSGSGGCGDVSLYARTESGDLELRFRASDAIDAAEAEGGAAVFVYELPDEAALLELRYGRLLFLACNDAIHPDTEVLETYTAVSGRATLTLDVHPSPASPGSTVAMRHLLRAGGRVDPLFLLLLGAGIGEPPPETLADATLLIEEAVLRTEGGIEVRIPELALPETLVGFTIP